MNFSQRMIPMSTSRPWRPLSGQNSTALYLNICWTNDSIIYNFNSFETSLFTGRNLHQNQVRELQPSAITVLGWRGGDVTFLVGKEFELLYSQAWLNAQLRLWFSAFMLGSSLVAERVAFLFICEWTLTVICTCVPNDTSSLTELLGLFLNCHSPRGYFGEGRYKPKVFEYFTSLLHFRNV